MPMVKFVVERTSANVRGYDKYQLRNDWNGDIKRRSDDLVDLASYALEYCGYQNTTVEFDLSPEDYALLAKKLGGREMQGFDLGL